MASSPLPILLGVGALLLLKGKAKSSTTTGTGTGTLPDTTPGTTPGTGTDSDASVGGGPVGGGGSTGGSTGSSGYKSVSISSMKVIQTQLATLGIDPGAIDGLWRLGGNTYDAVRIFQGLNGLVQDGKPGPITRAKLNEMVGASSTDPGSTDPDPPAGSSTQTEFTEDELLALPPLTGGNQVVFNVPLSDYAVGATWTLVTLEPWLNNRRLTGWLATKSNNATSYEGSSLQHSAEYWINKGFQSFTGAAFFSAGAVGGGLTASALAWSTPVTVPLAIATGVVISAAAAVATAMGWAGWSTVTELDYMEQTGALALQEFIKTQKVIVGPERKLVRIKDLKPTLQLAEFLGVVSDRIAKFQSSTYAD